VDNNEKIKNINHCRGCHWLDGKHEANQLNDKQRHARFDYYEYGVPKFGAPS
jgi:hypothetical protein